MEATAADLLAALSSPSPSSHAGLYSRYAAYLQPFAAHLPTSSQTGQRPPDAATALRPLAKRFLPFLSRTAQLLPPLLRATPNSPPRGACTGGDDDDLLGVYALVLDCLAAMSPCLAGKPYAVLLQRGRFACCLESRGRLARPPLRALSAHDEHRVTVTARRRLGCRAGSVILPDPGVAGDAGTDPDVVVLGVGLTVCLANCASKGKVKEPATYERVLVLVEQLQPWLRILTEHVSRKYLTLLVNAMARCSYFLVAESSSFSADLVHRFCASTLEECVNAQMIQHLLAVACKISSCVDLSWGGSTRLLLDLLKCTTDSVMCLKGAKIVPTPPISSKAKKSVSFADPIASVLGESPKVAWDAADQKSHNITATEGSVKGLYLTLEASRGMTTVVDSSNATHLDKPLNKPAMDTIGVLIEHGAKLQKQAGGSRMDANKMGAA